MNNSNESLKFFDDIDNWLFVQKKVVTYKYLSIMKNIHVNKAKLVLQEFKSASDVKGRKLQAVYYVSHILEDGSNEVKLLRENVRKFVSDKWEIVCEHIYSIQSADLPVSKELFDAVNKETLRANPIGAIKLVSIYNPILSSVIDEFSKRSLESANNLDNRQTHSKLFVSDSVQPVLLRQTLITEFGNEN